MSPSSATTTPMVLLIHDGELDDLRSLLNELGAIFVERKSAAPPPVRESEWSLILASPKSLSQYQLAASNSECVRLAIADADSRTMRALMRRIGVELVVCRPSHPAVLRLLILHALYRGPERRQRKRVSVGAAVALRAGMRRRRAILIDLSRGGCRLVSSVNFPPGTRLGLVIPPGPRGERRLRLRATVVRCVEAPDEAPEMCSVSIRFDRLGSRTERSLHAMIAAYQSGPAVLEAPAPAVPAPSPAQDPKTPRGPTEAGKDPRAEPSPDSASRELKPQGSGEKEAERRAEPRRRFQSRVIALDEGATRVLVGRDISLSGMRVDGSDALSVGDQLRIALHARSQESPLILEASVERDDGERGLVMRFQSVSNEQRAALDETLESLPGLPLPEDEEGEMLISEIVEHHCA